MENFDRQYRLAAGKAGSTGFEIGSGKRPLHISFSVEKADTNSQNTAKVTIWNLSDEHLAELRKTTAWSYSMQGMAIHVRSSSPAWSHLPRQRLTEQTGQRRSSWWITALKSVTPTFPSVIPGL